MVNERLTIFSRAVNDVHTFMKTPRSRKGSYGSSKHDYSKVFFARVNSLFLQEFQTTFHPGNLSMSFH